MWCGGGPPDDVMWQNAQNPRTPRPWGGVGGWGWAWVGMGGGGTAHRTIWVTQPPAPQHIAACPPLGNILGGGMLLYAVEAAHRTMWCDKMLKTRGPRGRKCSMLKTRGPRGHVMKRGFTWHGLRSLGFSYENQTFHSTNCEEIMIIWKKMQKLWTNHEKPWKTY